MFKSEESCRGGDCNSLYIQNKKYHLCSKCVYKKSHNGKSQQEMQMEKQKEKIALFNHSVKDKQVKGFKHELDYNNEGKLVGVSIVQDEESLKNEINQNIAEELEKAADQITEYRALITPKEVDITKYKESKTFQGFGFNKKKPIKKLSPKKAEIKKQLTLVYKEMDYITEPVCTGCDRYQGGDIKLSHSHIISQKECEEIGRPDLITNIDNLTYHCMSFAGNKGCHLIWENPKRRSELKDYQKNMRFIKLASIDLWNKYKSYEQ